MADTSFRAVPCIVADRVTLRVYKGGKLALEVPLRSRQAMVLAEQLLRLALLPDVNE